ncbi:uncharacterized protein LOC131943462 isoform X2 [Physella acuta]|uniref:uncharacterized protein LOC131943462 isoform X2 n=1 Tax=Physella acuta TaxID=109671 RepID=UPI0027DE6329|nr:uncharacterized protein LOC131943462 isoform X2 [Physella acuta]
MFVVLLAFSCLVVLPTHGEHDVSKYFIVWKDPPDLPPVHRTCVIATQSQTLVKLCSYVWGIEIVDRQSNISRTVHKHDWCSLHKRESWSNASVKLIKLESTNPVTLSVVLRFGIVLGSFLVPPRAAWDNTYYTVLTASSPSLLLLSDDDILVNVEELERDDVIQQDKTSTTSLSRYLPSELTFTNVQKLVVSLKSEGQFMVAAVSCTKHDKYTGCYTSEVYLGRRHYGLSHVLLEASADTESFYLTSPTRGNFLLDRQVVGHLTQLTWSQTHSVISRELSQCMLQIPRAALDLCTVIPVRLWSMRYLVIVPVVPEADSQAFLHVTFKKGCQEKIILGTNNITNILSDRSETPELGMVSGFLKLEEPSVDVYTEEPGCNFIVYLLGKEDNNTVYIFPLGFEDTGVEPFTMKPAPTTTESLMTSRSDGGVTTSVTGPQLCMPGMYGPTCQDECQCDGQACRQDGKCSNTGCGVGQYSGSCLSADALIFASSVSPAALADWDKSTCTHLVADTIHIRFPEVFPLESFTLVFQSQAHVTQMSLKFDLNSKDEYRGDMETADHTRVTFKFYPTLLSSQYLITVRTDTMLCSMHVYGGHEVTGLTADILTNGVKAEHLESQANKLVKDTPTLAQCIDLDPNIFMVTMPSWTHIIRIVVYTKEPSSAEAALRGFREMDVVLQLSRTLRHQVNHIYVMTALDHLEISVTSGNVTLCGVKFFQSAANHVEVNTTDLYTTDLWRQTNTATAPQIFHSTAKDAMTLERIMAYFSIAFAMAILVFACLVWYFRNRFV